MVVTCSLRPMSPLHHTILQCTHTWYASLILRRKGKEGGRERKKGSGKEREGRKEMEERLGEGEMEEDIRGVSEWEGKRDKEEEGSERGGPCERWGGWGEAGKEVMRWWKEGNRDWPSMGYSFWEHFYGSWRTWIPRIYDKGKMIYQRLLLCKGYKSKGSLYNLTRPSTSTCNCHSIHAYLSNCKWGTSPESLVPCQWWGQWCRPTGRSGRTAWGNLSRPAGWGPVCDSEGPEAYRGRGCEGLALPPKMTWHTTYMSCT